MSTTRTGLFTPSKILALLILARFFILSEVFWCRRESEIRHGGNPFYAVFMYSIL